MTRRGVYITKPLRPCNDCGIDCRGMRCPDCTRKLRYGLKSLHTTHDAPNTAIMNSEQVRDRDARIARLQELAEREKPLSEPRPDLR